MDETVSMEIQPTEIVEKKVNSNGQVYLGRELDGKKVKIAYEIVE